MEGMYGVIQDLCRRQQTNITALCRELGISRSAMSELKSGRTQTLSAKNTEKVAQHFGVSVGYLLGSSEDESDDSVREYLEVLKSRSEMRMLFSRAKDATKEDIERAVRVIEALKKE